MKQPAPKQPMSVYQFTGPAANRPSCVSVGGDQYDVGKDGDLTAPAEFERDLAIHDFVARRRLLERASPAGRGAR